MWFAIFLIALLFFVRLASLFALAKSNPYSLTFYLGNGGRSLSTRKHSAPLGHPRPRILLK